MTENNDGVHSLPQVWGRVIPKSVHAHENNENE